MGAARLQHRLASYTWNLVCEIIGTFVLVFGGCGSAVLAAGFPETVPATTIDRQCGSSQQAVHFGARIMTNAARALHRLRRWRRALAAMLLYNPGRGAETAADIIERLLKI